MVAFFYNNCCSVAYSSTCLLLLLHLLNNISKSIVAAEHFDARHCHGSPKHIHIAVGSDPKTQMTVSFATKWSSPDVEAPLGGIHIGTKPHKLSRFIPEQEEPVSYVASMGSAYPNEPYYAPYYHHITIDGLKPNTTYYYVVVTGEREKGMDYLREQPLRDHPSQHLDYWDLDGESGGEVLEGEIEEGVVGGGGHKTRNVRKRHYHNRRLSPRPYDGHNKPCLEWHQVRTFRTAPDTSDGPVSFAIIGDLGQFDHSKETLKHMKSHHSDIDAVILGGDIAYTGFDPRGWDTFFDFLDDYSMFAEIPLMIANGNHDIEKQDDSNDIFQAYEWRFRMPQVKPAELGQYDGPPGLLNMDIPPYPLPYEWGNAYYSFVYGPSKHIIVSAYSAMEPGSQQHDWLLEELESIDRSVTPWVIVTIHVPLYNTFSLHPHDLQIAAAQEHLEPLFVEYGVNMVFTGHIHAYLRTANVAMGTLNSKGPIHITIGAGGRKCDAPFKSEDAEEWVATRDASYYGYGRFDIFNKTHAEWRWIPLSPAEQGDYNVVKNEEVHLPPVQHDQLIIENQHFVTDEL